MGWPTVSIHQFGVIGDGIADESEAFHLAMHVFFYHHVDSPTCQLDTFI